MSTLYAQHPTPATAKPAGIPGLSGIELRKAIDTRAGRWLLIVIAAIAVVAAVISSVVGHDSKHTLQHILGDTCGFTAFLLPVLGILLVTSEWQQRTALTTFALTPRRTYVIAAKLVAGFALGVAATMVCTLLAGAGTALASHAPSAHPGPWYAAGTVIAHSMLYQVLDVLLGVALGLLLLNTPLALVVYFAIAAGWTILVSTVSGLHSVRDWLNPSTAWGHLSDIHIGGTTWAQVATAAAVWVVLPAVAGSVRVTKSVIR